MSESAHQHSESATAPSFVPRPLATMAGWAWRIIAVALAAALAGWVLLKFSLLLISLLVALLLTVIVEPLNSALKRKLHWPPAAAAATSLITLLLVLAAIIGGSGTGIYQGFTALGSNVQHGIDTLIEWATKTFPNLDQNINTAWEQLQGTLTGNSTRILGGVLNAGSSITSFFAGFILTFFALFFLLKDGRRLWHWFIRLLPLRYRNEANEAGIRAWVMLGNYTRTQAVVAFVDSVGIAIFAAFLHTPLSLVFPIAALVFLGAFIPIVGALLSGSIAVLVVLVNTGSPVMALLMLLGVLLVQQVEGHLLQPILQGNALNMHALAIVLLVAGGTALAGIAGALFTVPLAAAVNAMVLYLRGHDIFPYLNTMDDRPGGPKKDFTLYAQEYWDNFDKNVAQQLPPRVARARRRQLRAQARARRGASTDHQPAAPDNRHDASASPLAAPETPATDRE
ncbi:MAG: AI-2E family transporter [Arcanobacterium sp.]|nr:AI-2E family transporter [Arcanobacterium sp.]